MNFSFAGCGFLGIYHIGVSSCLRQHAPHLIDSCKFAGASAGAIVSCCLISGCDLGECTKFTLRLATKARSFSIGPLHPSFKITKILRDALREVLPDNAHEIASGRLFISLTRVSDRQSVIVSEYSSKEELIQALMCSAHVPLYSGLVPPVFRGVRYVDGGLSDNIPILNDQTISISPFAGESDICPTDRNANTLHIYLANTSMQCSIDNLYRMSRALFPPHPEILSDMCQQGFDDTLKYLQNNKLLSCVRHLSIRSIITPIPVDEMDSNEDEEDNCDEHSCYECKKKKQIALLDKLPTAVGSVLQDAVDEMNKGVQGYIHRHKTLKMLSFLATPWFLPVDISYTYAVRFLEYLPQLPHDVQVMYRETAELLRYLLTNIRHQRRRYTARFTCQLAITEVNYNQIESDIYPMSHHNNSANEIDQIPQNIRNLNFEFAMDLDSDLKNQRELFDSAHHHADNIHFLYKQRPRSGSANGRLSGERDKRKQKESTSTLYSDVFDSIEQCLHVTNQMESIMAYHYWDENNRESCRFEEIYTFQEGDINLSKLFQKDIDLQFDSKSRHRSHSFGHSTKKSKCTLEDDLEDFAGHKLEVVMKEKVHKDCS
ncbi:Patatin-like phospholipase domain-containing protein 2 [Mactra antiquata]